MRLKPYVFIGSLLVCLLAATYILTTAQSNITSVEPVPPLAAPPNHHIVYFVTNDPTQVSDLVNPQKLAHTLGSQTAHSWEEVLSQNTDQPIDALIIHNSKLNEVDHNWVSHAYGNGVTIAGLNISGPQMADLVGNRCIAQNNFAADTSLPMFVIVSSAIEGENPEEIARVLQTYSASCGESEAEGITGRVSMAHGQATDTLDSENGFNIFTLQLSLYLDNR